MNKKEIRMLAVTATLLVTVLILAIILILGLTRKNNQKESSVSSTATTQSVTESTAITETSAAPLYVIGEWNGKLAVFTMPRTDTPSKVYDVYLSSLPAEEQTRLKAGIPVYNEQKLQSLLEDYTS